MQELSQRVLRHIRRQDLIHPGQRVAVAVSGGADSVSLLRLLAELKRELGIVLLAAHFNHRLRGEESDGDQKFVEGLCVKLKIELLAGSGDVPSFAAREHVSIETAARRLRYRFFEGLIVASNLDSVATAHNLDDQAETVLMKLFRGAGTLGLAGIYPELALHGSGGSIIRPLLQVRRFELEGYLNELGQEWREDSTNRDVRHLRNRVRHDILPGIESTLNPSVRERLAETADLAREEENYWQAEVSRLLPQVTREGAIIVSEFRQLPMALQRRVVRSLAETLGITLSFHHIAAICDLSGADARSSQCSLTGDWRAFRQRDRLFFGLSPEVAANYEYPLPVPGHIEIPEAAMRLQTELISFSREYNPQHCFSRRMAGQQLRVRNWRAGDRFHPAHSKGPKKIKELLQQIHVLAAERKQWPVILAGDEIVWLRGFTAAYSLHEGEEAVMIREIALSAPVSRIEES